MESIRKVIKKKKSGSITEQQKKTCQKLLSLISGVSEENMKKGNLTGDEWKKLAEAAEQLGKLPIYIK